MNPLYKLHVLANLSHCEVLLSCDELPQLEQQAMDIDLTQWWPHPDPEVRLQGL